MTIYSRYDPSATGAFDGPMPIVVGVHVPGRVVQYTDVSQFEFVRDWINWCGGQSQERNGANVRLDEEDGTTIRWYAHYYLPLGGYLLEGETYITEQQVRSGLRPVTDWPADIRPMFDPAWRDPDQYTLPGAETYPGAALYPSADEDQR